MTARRDRPSTFAARAERAVSELALTVVADPRSLPEDVEAARKALLPHAGLDRRAVAAMPPERRDLLRALLRQATGRPAGDDRVAELAALIGRDGINAFGWRSPDGRRPPEGAPAAELPAPPVPEPVDPDEALGSWPARPSTPPIAPPAPPAPPASEPIAPPLASVFAASQKRR